MRRQVTVIAVMLVLVFSVSACTSYPECKWLPHDKEYGEIVDIDGVVYREYPETMWRPDIYNQERIKIGRLKGSDITYAVHAYELDVERIFISIEREWSFDANTPRWLYRKDIDLTEFSAENVDHISFKKRGNASKTEPFNNDLNDVEVIYEYFKAFEKASEPVGDYGDLGALYLQNSKHQGLCVIMWASACQGKYWIDFIRSDTEFFEVSQELMEKLVGEKLPTAEEFIEQYNADRD